MQKKLRVVEIAQRVELACFQANYELRQDARMLLERAVFAKNSEPAAKALNQLIANYQTASSKRMPLCQDCGYITVFVEMGNNVFIENGSLEEAIQVGVSDAYHMHNLRQSIINDALYERDNFATRKLATIHTATTRGSKLKMTVMAKGGGSDNASEMTMMKPTASTDDITDFILNVVSSKGSGACPPLFVGIGIGGSFDTVGLLAKKALLREFNVANRDPDTDKLEKQILEKINHLGIGPSSLGGEVTALGVSINTAPTHMACMPVAVNINCNSLRSVDFEL